MFGSSTTCPPRGSGSPAHHNKPVKPPLPARADAISVLQRQQQTLLAKAAAIDRAIRAQQHANAKAKESQPRPELVIVPPPRESSKKPAAAVPPSPAPERWSRVVPPDSALTFAAVWDPEEGMVTFSKPHLQDSPPLSTKAAPKRIKPGQYSLPTDQTNGCIRSTPSVPRDADAKSAVLSIDLLAAALGSGGDSALPSATFPKDVDAKSAVLTIDLLAAALSTPGPTSAGHGFNTARLALDAEANVNGLPLNFACEALEDLSAYLDAYFPGGIPEAAPSHSDGTSSIGVEAWVRRSLLPKLAESGEDYQLDWSALGALDKSLLHDPGAAFVEEWKGGKSIAGQEVPPLHFDKKGRPPPLRKASAESSTSKQSRGMRSFEDEGFYEVSRKPSPNLTPARPPVARSIVEDELNFDSKFSMTTTSTSNYIHVGFPTPLPTPRLPPIQADSESTTDNDWDIPSTIGPSYCEWERQLHPEPPTQDRYQTPSKKHLQQFYRAPFTSPSSHGPSTQKPRVGSPVDSGCVPGLVTSGLSSPASTGSPVTPSSVSPVTPAEVLARPTYNHNSAYLVPPTPAHTHYADLSPSQKPISGPMGLLPATVSQIPSLRRKASGPSQASRPTTRKLIKGKFGSLRSKIRPFAFDEDTEEGDDDGWVGVTVEARG